VRPLLGGEGAGEGEPMLMRHSPAREVKEAVEEITREQCVSMAKESGEQGRMMENV